MIEAPTRRLRSRRIGAYGASAVLLILIAVGVRIVALDRLPLPVQQDELSNIYDGYCLANYGTDRHGVSWPFLVQAMGPGDYRPALYAYLASVTTRFSEFSIVAGRVPAAIAGILTVLLIYLTATRLLGRSGGLIALAYATFSPILIQYSRQAHEGACLPPMFSVLSLYCVVRAWDDVGRRRQFLWWLLAAGVAIGLSTSAYGTQRLTAPLTVIVVAAISAWSFGLVLRRRMVALHAVMVLGAGALLGASPQLWSLVTDSDAFFARSHTLALDSAYGPTWWINRVVSGYAAHWDPRLLFFSFGTYGELTVARLSQAAFPVLYLGLAMTFFRCVWLRDRRYILLWLAVVISILPAVVTRGNMAIMRASGVWSLYPIMCAIGMCAGGSWLLVLWRRLQTGGYMLRLLPDARIALAGCVVVIASVGTWTIGRFVTSPELHGVMSQHHFVDIAKRLKGSAHEYERVYVDAPGAFGYLYLAAFFEMSPRQFQDAMRDRYVSRDGWNRCSRFGKFRFADAASFENDWRSAGATGDWLCVDAQGRSIKLRPDGRRINDKSVALQGDTELQSGATIRGDMLRTNPPSRLP